MTSSTTLNAVRPPLPERVQIYLREVIQACAHDGRPVVCLVLFGSTAKGGFSDVSDVDLIVVLPDEATPADKRRLRATITQLEGRHGLRPIPPGASWRIRPRIERAAGHLFPCCVCTRSELLSGDAAQVLGLHRWEAPFLDRIVFASIAASAVTISGEDIVPKIHILPIRRVDVFRALFALCCQLGLALVTFPFLPDATKFAMAALKHSLHSCYFCYHGRTTLLTQEVAFFNRRFGASRTLVELLSMRRQYRRSFAFVLRCAPTIVALHLRTAWDARLSGASPSLSNRL
jgi:predicted nucleotidyltransferase